MKSVDKVTTGLYVIGALTLGGVGYLGIKNYFDAKQVQRQKATEEKMSISTSTTPFTFNAPVPETVPETVVIYQKEGRPETMVVYKETPTVPETVVVYQKAVPETVHIPVEKEVGVPYDTLALKKTSKTLRDSLYLLQERIKKESIEKERMKKLLEARVPVYHEVPREAVKPCTVEVTKEKPCTVIVEKEVEVPYDISALRETSKILQDSLYSLQERIKEEITEKERMKKLLEAKRVPKEVAEVKKSKEFESIEMPEKILEEVSARYQIPLPEKARGSLGYWLRELDSDLDSLSYNPSLKFTYIKKQKKYSEAAGVIIDEIVDDRIKKVESPNAIRDLNSILKFLETGIVSITDSSRVNHIKFEKAKLEEKILKYLK